MLTLSEIEGIVVAAARAVLLDRSIKLGGATISCDPANELDMPTCGRAD